MFWEKRPLISASKRRWDGKFLGIIIKKTGPSEISLTQPGFNEKVLKVTGMSDADGIHTPTTGEPVGADLDGLDLKEDW